MDNVSKTANHQFLYLHCLCVWGMTTSQLFFIDNEIASRVLTYIEE